MGVVGDGGLAGAVDRVAGGAAECIVVARQVEVILPLVRTVADEVVGEEVRDNACRGRADEVADAVVRHCDGGIIRQYPLRPIFSFPLRINLSC